MELQELTQLWNSADKTLENKLKINKKLLREVSITRARSHLTTFKWTTIAEFFANAIFLFFLLDFTANNFQLKYAVPAILLIILMIGGIIFSSYKLSLYYKIDVKTPVIQAQKTMERLKYYELLEKNMLYVIIPVFSGAFLIVLAKAFLNYDLYEMGTWLISQIAGSFFIALIVVFLLKRYPNKDLQKVTTFYKELREAEMQEE